MIVSLAVTLDVDVVVDGTDDEEKAKELARNKALAEFPGAIEADVLNVSKDFVVGGFITLHTCASKDDEDDPEC